MDNFDKNLVIIRTDGGIGSQIAFYALGKYFSDKGYKVKFDMTWFEENGMDVDNKFVRNYDLDKAFPDLPFEKATKKEIEYYSFWHKMPKKKAIKECKAPLYIKGYPEERPFLMVLYKDYFKKFFKFNTENNEQLELLKEIENTNSVGVHVRRGDIATSCCYGKPADTEYFVKAMNMINNNSKNAIFYLFSDEPEWIEENILPKVKNLNCKLCSQNGSDKGYLDLYLISKCKHIISSNGSMGIGSYILSDCAEELYTCKYVDYICEKLDNIIVLNYPDTIKDKNEIYEPRDKVPLKDKIFSIKENDTYLTITIMFIKIKFNKRKRK